MRDNLENAYVYNYILKMATEVIMNILDWPKISFSLLSRKCIYKLKEYTGQHNRIEDSRTAEFYSVGNNAIWKIQNLCEKTPKFNWSKPTRNIK